MGLVIMMWALPSLLGGASTCDCVCPMMPALNSNNSVPMQRTMYQPHIPPAGIATWPWFTQLHKTLASAYSVGASNIASLMPQQQPFIGPQQQQPHEQQQQEDDEATDSGWAWVRLAHAASQRSVAFEQLVYEQPQHAAQQRFLNDMRGFVLAAHASGATPAAAPAVMAKVEAALADALSGVTAALMPHTQAAIAASQSAVAPAAVNTTCSYNEAPARTMPATNPAPAANITCSLDERPALPYQQQPIPQPTQCVLSPAPMALLPHLCSTDADAAAAEAAAAAARAQCSACISCAHSKWHTAASQLDGVEQVVRERMAPVAAATVKVSLFVCACVAWLA